MPPRLAPLPWYGEGPLAATVLLLVAGLLASGWWGFGVAAGLAVSLLLCHGFFVGGPVVSELPGPQYGLHVGQMVIGTIWNAACAAGLGVVVVLVAGRVNVSPPRALMTAVAVATVQGIGLPLYAWWHWFGERDRQAFVDALVERLKSPPPS